MERFQCLLEAAAGNCMFWKNEGSTSKAFPEGALGGVIAVPTRGTAPKVRVPNSTSSTHSDLR